MYAVVRNAGLAYAPTPPWLSKGDLHVAETWDGVR
jgi:hypothetical protein